MYKGEKRGKGRRKEMRKEKRGREKTPGVVAMSPIPALKNQKSENQEFKAFIAI